MATRLALLASLVVLSTAGFAQQPPPKKADKAFFTTVAALNNIFKQDTTGTIAKKFVGRTVTVTGTVKEVGADGGGQKLTLEGLPAADTEPTGCAVPFGADHKSLEVVKGLKSGTTVVIRGEIDTVTGTAFTLKSPVLVSTSAGAVATAPTATTTTPKRPSPSPAPATGSRVTPEPYRAPQQLPAAERTMTAEELSAKLLADKTGEIQRRYKGQVLDLTGVVRSSRPVSESIEKGAWSVDLVGTAVKGSKPTRVSLYFRPSSPALPRVRNICVGDAVTLRGVFDQLFVRDPLLAGEEVVRGGDPQAVLTPARQLTADALFKELWAGPDAITKARGQAVAVTGVIGLDPAGTTTGLKLDVRYAGAPPLACVECDVGEEQLEAVRQLPPGLKVRVVGVIALTEPERAEVWLGRCRVSLLEPNLTPSVSVNDLVTAYRDNNKAAGERYGNRTSGKWLYVTGEVESVTADRQKLRTAHLKGPAGPKVQISIGADDQIKAGQTVRVKTFCEGALPQGYIFRLSMSSISPEPKTPVPLEK